MLEHKRTEQASAVFLAVLMVGSVVGMGVVFSGAAVADSDLEVELNEISGFDDANENAVSIENLGSSDEVTVEDGDIDGADGVDDFTTDAVQPNTGDEITVNYSVAPGEAAVEEVTLTFVPWDDNIDQYDTVERTLAENVGQVDAVEESVSVPDAEGFYAVEIEAVDADGNVDTQTVTLNDGDYTGDADNAGDGLLIVHEEEPQVGITSPAPGTSDDEVTLEGTAFDGFGIEEGSVDLVIENSSGDVLASDAGDFADSTGWNDDSMALGADIGTVVNSEDFGKWGAPIEWELNTFDDIGDSDEGISPDEYTAVVNATDTNGNDIGEVDDSGGVPDAPDEDEIDRSVPVLEFTIISVMPGVENVKFAESGEDFKPTFEFVENEDDQLAVNVTLSERGTPIGELQSVEIQIDTLGIAAEIENPEDTQLEVESAVDDIDGPEGEADVTVVLERDDGEVTSASTIEDSQLSGNALYVNRVPGGAEAFELETDFLGIVHDESDSIDLDLQVTDADGNPVSTDPDFGSNLEDVGEIDITIGDENIASVGVEDGNLATDVDIEPDDISVANVDLTDDLAVTFDGATIETFDVTLVHEVYGLAADQYQPVGTPMQANDVVVDSADDVSTFEWDPDAVDPETNADGWVVPDDETAAGAGFIVNPGSDDDARIGFDFETGNVDERSEVELSPGEGDAAFHLVGATPTLQAANPDTAEIEIEDDLLEEEVEFDGDSNIEIWTPDDDQQPWISGDDSPPIDWNSKTASDVDDDDTIEEFAAYWIQLDAENTETLTRIITTEPYDPEDREN